MPPRRDPIKTRELSTLLRDARTTQHEIDSAPTEHKQRELRHARDSARAKLIKLHHFFEKHGYLDWLDIGVRNFVADLIASNRKNRRRRLPKSKGGRPPGKDKTRLHVAVAIQEALEAHEGEKGRVKSALTEVASAWGLSYEYVREIHENFDQDRNSEWELAVKAELDRTKLREHEDEIDLDEIDLEASFRSEDEADEVTSQKKTWWRPRVEEVPRIVKRTRP